MSDHSLALLSPSVRALQSGMKTLAHMLVGAKRPKFAAGDQVWIRESYQLDPETDLPIYKADTPPSKRVYWRPPQAMQRKHSRLLITIASIDKHPLKRLTAQDMEASGVVAIDRRKNERIRGWSSKLQEHDPLIVYPELARYWTQDPLAPFFARPDDAFAAHWNAEHAYRAQYDDNPDVWAIRFELVRSPAIANALKGEDPIR